MTFLFDIGNVLLNLHFDRFHEKVLGQSDAPLPPEMSVLKDPYETGKLSDQEFVEQSLALLKSNLTAEEYTRAWEDIFSPNLPMWAVVRKLEGEGHRLILFSNTNAIHAHFFMKEFEIFSLFHHHHFSQEVGAIKPHREFYQTAVDQYDLDPEQTVYFDDLPENIATGKEFGFHCWQYDLNDHEACANWLPTVVSV